MHLRLACANALGCLLDFLVRLLALLRSLQALSLRTAQPLNDGLIMHFL